MNKGYLRLLECKMNNLKPCGIENLAYRVIFVSNVEISINVVSRQTVFGAKDEGSANNSTVPG